MNKLDLEPCSTHWYRVRLLPRSSEVQVAISYARQDEDIQALDVRSGPSANQRRERENNHWIQRYGYRERTQAMGNWPLCMGGLQQSRCVVCTRVLPIAEVFTSMRWCAVIPISMGNGDISLALCLVPRFGVLVPFDEPAMDVYHMYP